MEDKTLSLMYSASLTYLILRVAIKMQCIAFIAKSPIILRHKNLLRSRFIVSKLSKRTHLSLEYSRGRPSSQTAKNIVRWLFSKGEIPLIIGVFAFEFLLTKRFLMESFALLKFFEGHR
jgi:hypothetical protein